MCWYNVLSYITLSSFYAEETGYVAIHFIFVPPFQKYALSQLFQTY